MKFLSLTHTVSRLLVSFDKPTALRSSQLWLLLCQETTLFQHLLCKYIQWRYLFVSQSILITLESESWIWKMLEMSSLLKGDAFQFKRLQKVFVPLHWLEDHLSWIFNRLFGSKMTGNFSRLAFVMSLRLLFYLCVAYKLPSVRCISGVVHTSLKAGKWPDFFSSVH